MTTLRRVIAIFGVIAASAATGGVLAPAAPAHAATYWGAIAHNSAGQATWVVDFADSYSAASAVMGKCGSDCGYFTFANSCAAIAYTSDLAHYNRVWGYRTPDDAAGAAVRGLPYAGYLATYACTTR